MPRGLATPRALSGPLLVAVGPVHSRCALLLMTSACRVLAVLVAAEMAQQRTPPQWRAAACPRLKTKELRPKRFSCQILALRQVLELHCFWQLGLVASRQLLLVG